MITVPQGFVLIEQGPLTLVVHQDYREQLLQCGLGDPERLCAQQTGAMHAGRGAMPVIELDISSERIVVRKYRRGGLLRFLNADVFLGPQRPFDELAVTLQAAKAGIPVADILGALSLRVCGPLYRHYLVSRELTDCCDLPAWFQECDVQDADVAVVARCVAERVRCMHDNGLYHGDLNLKNILVSRTDVGQVFIIDWDKSTHRPGTLGPDERQRNVVRFCRSAEKLRTLRGIPVPEQFTDIFLEHYWHNPALADISRHSLRRALKHRALFWRFPGRSS
jgi:tRNA A-37 threonylcarbamoyl transferase component Bud32